MNSTEARGTCPTGPVPLYLIADTGVCSPERLIPKVEEALEAGVRAVRLRDHRLSTRELLSLAKKFRDRTSHYDATFFVSDRLDLFWESGADGIHLPEEGLPIQDVRAHAPSAIIGKSVHSLEGALEAERAGADFITFSPIFETPSKMGILKPRGLSGLQDVCQRVKIPVLGLGGISPANAKHVLNAGASGVAVIRSILNESSIKNAVADFKNEMRDLL